MKSTRIPCLCLKELENLSSAVAYISACPCFPNTTFPIQIFLGLKDSLPREDIQKVLDGQVGSTAQLTGADWANGAASVWCFVGCISVIGVGQSGRTLEVFTGSEYFLTGSSLSAFSCLQLKHFALYVPAQGLLRQKAGLFLSLSNLCQMCQELSPKCTDLLGMWPLCFWKSVPLRKLGLVLL